MAFQEVPAAYLLPGLIAEARQKETIFVDTPGYTGADENAADAAAAALAECPHLDVHLVVPGYMKARDLHLCIEKYARFRPTKLLVTKMDETQTFGSIFSEPRGRAETLLRRHGLASRKTSGRCAPRIC
jgi:flagellar biosynthesis protein FlhF